MGVNKCGRKAKFQVRSQEISPNHVYKVSLHSWNLAQWYPPMWPPKVSCLSWWGKNWLSNGPLSTQNLVSTCWFMLCACWAMTRSPLPHAKWTPCSLPSIYFNAFSGASWCTQLWEEETQVWSPLDGRLRWRTRGTADCWQLYNLGGSKHRTHN